MIFEVVRRPCCATWYISDIFLSLHCPLQTPSCSPGLPRSSRARTLIAMTMRCVSAACFFHRVGCSSSALRPSASRTPILNADVFMGRCCIESFLRFLLHQACHSVSYSINFRVPKTVGMLKTSAARLAETYRIPTPYPL